MSKISSLILSILISSSVLATEGMWVPGMIKQLVASDMKALGMKVNPSDLYAINQSSIKDAVVHFNGGCTSVLVSNRGLLLTNHHCGYSSIQSHSTLENNYLKDGFWASDLSKELSNPNMDATIIKEIRDVTDEILAEISIDTKESERDELVKQRVEALVAKVKEETGYSAYVKPFYHGNQFLLFITEVFKDLRLVGAPPSSVGKFGFDTDNWMWPRHTGDFSVFRIYADADNKPAEYSEENKPYRPNHVVPVNLGGVKKDDFTLVYGFPGYTQNYIPEAEVKSVIQAINPLRIKMREASLSVIDEAMRKDELTKIKYAAKQSRISNAYKKWIGQSKGLIRHRALEQRDSIETLFEERIDKNAAWKEKYVTLIAELASLEEQSLPLQINRNYFIEFYYMGPEIFRYVARYRELVAKCKNEEVSDEEVLEWIEEQKKKQGFFKNYDVQIDKDIMKAQIEQFVNDQKPVDFLNDLKKEKETLDEFVDRLYEESMFTSEEKVMEMLDGIKRKKVSKIEEDPAYDFSNRLNSFYYEVTRPALLELVTESDSLMRVWMAAQMEVLPERTYSPDANGTLRITFGKVEGYEPYDGAWYKYYTTLDGVMEKEDPNNPEYNVHEKLKKLHTNKDYGRYADSTGQMNVCFLASNHTSGGNSGSPVFDANGHLIGLNFDRTWESTMSDIMFNPQICRNITVDIRYVLFIMDKFASAGHLVNEMELVEGEE